MAAKGLVRNFKPLEILTEEQVEQIHRGALDVLEVTGVRVDSERALKIYEKGGCIVDYMVLLTNCDKITPGMLMAARRLNIPAIVVTGGPMEAGCFRGGESATPT